MQTFSHDVMIIGGGMVGLTFACALAQQTPLSIAILEANPFSPVQALSSYHHRVSAIALSSQRIFQNLTVWPAMQRRRISQFKQIQVWESVSLSDIQFDSCDIGEAVLGYIMENNVMHTALHEKITGYSQIELISPVELIALEENENAVCVKTADGRSFSAPLCVAADGGKFLAARTSWHFADKKSYEQQAIVATVHTALPHEQIARQVFHPSYPRIFATKSANTSSIVWTNQQSEAERLLALSDMEFKTALTQAFDARLGDVLEVEPRYAFPLHKLEAKQYVKPRIALIGDAAHILHPLAGQGVNVGLLDAVSLAEVVVEAYQQRRDYGSYASLRRYERWRRADNQLLLNGIDLIKQFFENDKSGIQALRSFGLTATNHLHFLKNIFSRHAVGNRSGLPKLANALYFEPACTTQKRTESWASEHLFMICI